jgi:hypothetical protein
VALVVIAGLYLVDGQRQLDKFITITPFSSEALRDRKSDLQVEAQRRSANPPLPVGIVAAGASDGATRIIEGLPDSADLSLGGRSDHERKRTLPRPCRGPPARGRLRGSPNVRFPIPIAAFRAQGRLGQLSATSGLYVEGQRPSRRAQHAARLVPVNGSWEGAP